VPEDSKDRFGLRDEPSPVTELDWRRSSLCGAHGSCVEVAPTPDGGVAIRNGETPGTAPVLFFSRDEWEAFVAGVRAGEFG
jgi:Domain of unknown function (DUF397)